MNSPKLPEPAIIGLVVNPVAGLGGPVGLKGSDGYRLQRAALERGARPSANSRALSVMRRLAEVVPGRFTLLTAGGPMGETAAMETGLKPLVVSQPGYAEASTEPLSTTAQDTIQAVRGFRASGAELVLFVGGDGTARDVHSVLADDPGHLALGIPGGVKMQSAVFARSAEESAAIVIDWLESPGRKRWAEVADIDEEARSRGLLASQLHGYLYVPDTSRELQGGKVGSSATAESLAGLAIEAHRRIDPEAMCVLGPGKTVQAVAARLSGTASLLGVDLAHRGQLIGTDLSAAELNRLTADHRIQLVVSPVGGQGFLFGRGNQQLDAALLTRVNREDLLILCSEGKLAELGGGPLYIDVPEMERSERFTGYHRVISGLQQTAGIKVRNAQTLGL